MKKFLERVHDGMSAASATLGTLVKTAVMSRRPSRRGERKRETLIVLGNGPSLKEALEKHRNVIMSHPRMAVNLSVLAPGFADLRPQYYILADPAFFAREKKGKIPAVWDALAAVDWEMVLFLPAVARGTAEVAALPDNVTVKYYNLTPGEGWDRAVWPLYDAGLAMPRPRNVLVPAMMCAVREGFRRIALAGADHNWALTLWVTDRNRVVSVQPHFYKEDSEELKRCEEVFAGLRLHDVYGSYAVAFRSYHQLAHYFASRGVEVLNVTPGSFIDAFPRGELGELR